MITIKFYTKPYSIFLQRNGTYFLNKPRNSEELFEVAATDFIARIAVTHHVLAHPLEDLWHVYRVSHAAAFPSATSASIFTGDSLRSTQRKKSGAARLGYRGGHATGRHHYPFQNAASK